MLFIAVLFFFLGYLAIAIGVAVAATKWAKKYGRRPWVWGSLAAFVMYNLVFWDWIPTLVAHKYYCDKEAALTIYKTPEQWKKENPGVVEKLKPFLVPRVVNLPMGNVSQVNDRFGNLFLKESTGKLPIRRHRDIIIDVNTHEIVAMDIDFRRGNALMAIGGAGSWKFWLHADSCYADSERHNLNAAMGNLYDQLHLR